jgi:hypothetical protein
MTNWKQHPEHTNYEISNDGQVRNIKTQYLLKYTLSDGYHRVHLCGKRYRVHRLVAETYLPNPDAKKFVNHIDGVRDHNRVENIEWATPSENTLHTNKHLSPKVLRGEEIYNTILTEEIVKDIKLLREAGWTPVLICWQLNLDKPKYLKAVKNVIYNKTWKHIK